MLKWDKLEITRCAAGFQKDNHICTLTYKPDMLLLFISIQF